METLDARLEFLALDEPHGIVRSTGCVGTQPVNRNDAWMLELSRYFSFLNELGPISIGVGKIRSNLFQCDFPSKLLILRNMDNA